MRLAKCILGLTAVAGVLAIHSPILSAATPVPGPVRTPAPVTTSDEVLGGLLRPYNEVSPTALVPFARPYMPFAARPCIVIIIIILDYSAKYGGFSETITASGQVDLDVTESSDQPWSETLKITNVSFAGDSPKYGSVKTGADLSQATTPTTVTANQDDSKLPATGNIYFYPTVELGAYPGVTFTSTEEQQLQNTNLNSYDPQVNESWKLVNSKLNFVDDAGEEAFTLTSQTTTIN